MSNTELPPLPDPIHMGLEEVDWNEFVPVTGYTADQMSARYRHGVKHRLTSVFDLAIPQRDRVARTKHIR